MTVLLQKFISRILFFLIAVYLLPACASKHAFTTSSVVPAAEGSVKVKQDGNNNYKINVELNRLAEPTRLNPPKQLYIVWMQTAENGRKNIGQLKTSSGFLSGKLKSSLETVSAFKPVRVFITAEDEATIQYPTGTVVLETSSF